MSIHYNRLRPSAYLRDDPKNGCEGECISKRHRRSVSISYKYIISWERHFLIAN